MSDNNKVYEEDIDDLLLDENNANKHTKKGLDLLDKSIEDNGVGRSILSTSEGTVIAGNATLKTLRKRGVKKVLTVEVSGDTAVNVKRIDLKADDEEAKGLALADNRVAEVNLNWDYEVLNSQFDKGTLDKYSMGNVYNKGMGDPGGFGDGEPGESGGVPPGVEYPDGELPVSHIKMVQLFLTTQTEPEFRAMVNELEKTGGTENVTETVFRAVQFAFDKKEDYESYSREENSSDNNEEE